MLSRFALTIWRASVDRLAYIEDFAKRRTGSGMGYLYALTTTLAFFSLLPLAIWLAVLAPSTHGIADRQLAIFENWYPDELTVTISGGVLSTDVPQPYVLDVPPEWASKKDSKNPAHLIVIDTNAAAEDFETYDTFVLLTDDVAVTHDKDNGSMRVYSFKDIDEPVVVSKKQVSDVVGSLRTFTPSLPWLAGVGVLAMIFLLPWILGGFMWLANLFYLLWATLLLMIASSVMRRNMRYGQLYKLGLFGVTSSAILGFALLMTGLQLPGATSVLFFVWMIAVLTAFPQSENAKKSAPLPPADAKAMADRPAQTLKR